MSVKVAELIMCGIACAFSGVNDAGNQSRTNAGGFVFAGGTLEVFAIEELSEEGNKKMSVEIKRAFRCQRRRFGKLGRWKEVAQGMEVGGPGVLLKGEGWQ